MSGSQKAIKVISIITIVMAVICFLVGLTTCVGAGALIGAGADATADAQSVYTTGAGLFLVLAGGAIFSGIIDLVVGILGLRGAKNPAKIMPFFVIAIIGAVFAVINLAGEIMGLGSDSSSIASAVVQLVLMVVCVVLANNVRKQRG